MITINDTNKLHGKDRIYFRPLIQLISRVNHLLSANCGYEPVKLQLKNVERMLPTVWIYHRNPDKWIVLLFIPEILGNLIYPKLINPVIPELRIR